MLRCKYVTFAQAHLLNVPLAGFSKGHFVLQLPDFVFLWRLLSGWSAALAMLHFVSGTSRPVSVCTSSWVTWRRCAAFSMTGAGWSAVPMTSWSKFGIQKQKPACTRCRATRTECTPYRYADLCWFLKNKTVNSEQCSLGSFGWFRFFCWDVSSFKGLLQSE